MQDIVFYAAANETLGVVRDYANSRNEYAPTLVLGVSVCLRMRLFAGSESAEPFPVDSFSGITGWKWRMDSDFDRETPYKLTADSNGISVQTVTDTINGETLSFTEFAIQISDMNTQELTAWLGTEKKKTGLTGELVGYDSSGNAIFVLQIDDFTVRNRIAGLNEPTSNDQEYLTRSETEQLVQTEITSAAAAKQDKLTSANAGAGIAIDSGGTISMACVILGATNGVKIADGKVQFDPETAIGADGNTRGAIVTVADGLLVAGGTASIDDASVADVLVGIDGGNASISDEVVTPGNLRGALSLGQAVDVSCKPYNNSGSISFTNNDFLQGFTCSMLSGTTVGFYDTGTHKFPKFVSGLKYLMIADVTGSGSITPNGGTAVTLSNASRRLAMTVLASGTGYFSASAAATVNVTNWRQYEVTSLTDEAIAYLATLPDPDDFFRSATVASVLGKYLVKQDMVCPWIRTIGMPENSDLTVAAGLSYQIKYTNDNPHNITVDTIPADAYGWDTHIQMFIKGTSSVVFQPPLILMDALTPNAGHNLVIKYRNGDALVYVDDTNAGNIVLYAAGTTAGTLNCFLQQDPGSGQENYIIFAAATDGLTCDAGTVSVAYNTDILGNGTDNTAITGAFSVAGGKTMNLQDLAVTGSTLSGTGAIDLSNVAVDGMVSCASSTLDGIKVPAGKTLVLSEIYPAVLDCDLEGTLVWNKSTASSNKYWFKRLASASGGVLTATESTTYIRPVSDSDVLISGITIAGGTNGLCISPTSGSGHSLAVEKCYIYGNDSAWMYGGDGWSVIIRNSVIKDNTADGLNQAAGYIKDGLLHVEDTTIENNSFQLDGTASAYVKGTFTIKGDCYGFHVEANQGPVTVFPGSIIDMSRQTGAQGLTNGNWRITLGDDVTIRTADGRTAVIDAADGLKSLSNNAELTALSDVITITGSTAGPWRANNVTFVSPLDAHEAFTVQLAGTTFTSASMIADSPTRIQLPAGSTVSLSGNTNAENTRILQAPIIVVGDNPASPGGSATVINAAGTSSTVSGIGTYIDKEGDNDFTALSNVNSVTVTSGGSSTAGTLASAFAQTTGEAGENRWVKLANDLTASVNYVNAGEVVDKRVITADYEHIIGGTYSFAAGAAVAIDEATKTATIGGGNMRLTDADIAKGATVAVGTGGAISAQTVKGNGGTINLGGTNLTFSDGTYSMSGVSIISGSAATHGGAVYVHSSSVVNLTGTTISNNTATDRGGGVFLANRGAVLNATSAVITNNSASRGGGINTNGRLVNLTGTTITGNSAATAGGGIMGLDNSVVNITDCFIANNTPTEKGVYVYKGSITMAGSNYLSDAICCTSGTITIASGAVVDLTGNANNDTIYTPGGSIVFESGGATVYPSAGSAAAYMLDNISLPAGAKLKKTAVVDLARSNITIASNTTASASGATFSGGYVNIAGGAFYVSGSLLINDCIVSGNSADSGATGGAIGIASGATASIVGSVVHGNGGTTPNKDLFVGGSCVISASTVGIVGVAANGVVTIRGNNTITQIKPNSSGVTGGSVTISSGATITLTSNVEPGGDITLYGGASLSPTTIVGGGISRIFEDVEIHGSTISSQGIIYGATVYSNIGDDHYVYFTEDGGATSSSVIVTGATEYVVPGGLVRIVGT